MNVEHLHLHVRDRALAEQFYTTWFDMRIARRGECLTFLTDGGGFDLALMEDATPTPMPAWFHFGFRLEGALRGPDPGVVSLRRSRRLCDRDLLGSTRRPARLTSPRSTKRLIGLS
jgi:catechol 2,3-dioxygenase-like lactoylglutathione lyase family enzyme